MSQEVIPKVIHYCWFGRNPLPQLALKCIESWKKFFPDYEIKEWTEDNFDVNIIPYTTEAYKAKKYAFVSDYARFWILYNYGGIYFDTDVEIIKSMDDIIAKGPFMGCENDITEISTVFSTDGIPKRGLGVAPGLGLGTPPGLGLYKELLDLYASTSFITKDGKLNLKTVVSYTTELLYRHGLKNTRDIQYVDGIYIYPKEYFNPWKNFAELATTPNSRSIHHCAGSWASPWKRFHRRVRKMLGPKLWSIVKKTLKR